MEIADAHLFRVIRETDIVLQEDEAVDLLETVDQGLRDIRHGPSRCSRSTRDMPARVLDILIENFEVERDVVMRSSARLGFADWMALTGVERPKLKDVPLVSADDLAPAGDQKPSSSRSSIATRCCTIHSIRSPRSKPFSMPPSTMSTSSRSR